MGPHPCQLLVITALLTFGFVVVTAQGPQVYTLCEPNQSTTMDLTATSTPFLIRSPLFPGPYPGNLNCQLVLQSAFEPLVLTFKVSSFDVESEGFCNFDSLCVHGAKLCGWWPAGKAFQYILPANRAFTIGFRTDLTITSGGFNILVTSDLALTGQEIFQPLGIGSNSDQLRYVQVVYPSVPPTPDVCTTMTGDVFLEPNGDTQPMTFPTTAD
ncbi:hypothetical protein BsWGS_21951 [Bradybaena similaris]